MALVWYLDRASALLAYSALYLAVVSGVFFNACGFGTLHALARRYHVLISVFATILLLIHGAVGVADSALLVGGFAPAPTYPMWYFVAGAAVGGGALLLLLVAVLGFVDARRFSRPWSPRVVHAFAYGGYVFATAHMLAVGSDVGATVRLGAIAGVAFLAYALLLRLLVETGVLQWDSSPASKSTGE
ncbi:MAG: hypothetical protein ABEJ28_00390 [Salinigranum sp.]